MSGGKKCTIAEGGKARGGWMREKAIKMEGMPRAWAGEDVSGEEVQHNKCIFLADTDTDTDTDTGTGTDTDTGTGTDKASC